ncbi:MAG: hypothetical protein V4661_15250 [Pseudomonadota bacterium]
MTDPNANGDIKNSGNHADEASLVPDSTDMIVHGTKEAADEPASSPSEMAVPRPSKDIVLQRLTPHSSWEDFVFNESAAREETASPAAAATEAPARRFLPIAAIVALAASVGAIGGALATVGVGHFMKSEQTAAAAVEQSRSVESAVAKINADIAALKASGSAQSAKLVERVDRIEKAQAEPAAKLAKLSDAVDKLRAADATGSINPPAAAAPVAAAQPARLPVVDGWVLREVSDGIATVQGRQGIFDVLPGDPLPGVGRVDAIRRQDGRWVVVTSRGLIIAR